MRTRRRRGDERGHVAIVVAISGVTLLAITGLALDGGMEAGAYRHAQNAADAGALAAARQEFRNAMASPQVASNQASLSPIAQREVAHNGAQFAWLTSSAVASAAGVGGTTQSMTADGMSVPYVLAAATPTPTPAAGTWTQTAWVPTGGGLSGQSALAQLTGIAGTLLSPLNAGLQVDATQSTAVASSSGSTAGSQIALGSSTVAGANAYANCWTATAAYHAGTTTTGSPVACPLGSFGVGVSVTGTPLGGGGTDARVDSNNAPTATPRMQGVNVGGSITSPIANVLGTVASVSATSAASGSSLRWDLVNGLTATSEVYASGVHVVMPGVTMDTTQMYMAVTASIDPATGTPTVTATCTPTTLTFTKTGNVQVVVTVDSSCGASNLSALGLGATLPYEQPSPLNATNACTVNNSTGFVACSAQTCFLHLAVNTAPYQTTLCLGQADVGFNGQPVTIPPSGCTPPCCAITCGGGGGGGGGDTPNPLFQQFTGKVTVAATIAQPTYFLRVLGWSQTNPSATATADVEPVVDESQAAFASSPFGMPDMATTMTGTITYERLQAGHTYYLYGPNMQSYNPAASMPSAWQGQLSTGSPHRVGNTLTGTASLTTTPQPYLSNGPYYLEPVFDPLSGAVEYYGVFVPVAGQAHWGELVNSVPSLHGFIVQATSVSSWIVFDEGAVSVKLVQ